MARFFTLGRVAVALGKVGKSVRNVHFNRFGAPLARFLVGEA